jgi:hypothetical protein
MAKSNISNYTELQPRTSYCLILHGERVSQGKKTAFACCLLNDGFMLGLLFTV